MAAFSQGGVARGSSVADYQADRRSCFKLESNHCGYCFDRVGKQPRNHGRDSDVSGGKVMSVTQTMFGGGILVVVGSAILQSILPGPSPIVVHSLSYENGFVTQDRTVSADDGVFFAQWRAEVVDVADDYPVANCSGSGSWNYPSGRSAPEMSLPVWTGNPLCDESQLPDQFYLRATWVWGDDQTSGESIIYEGEQ